jgi:hypothetical protein
MIIAILWMLLYAVLLFAAIWVLLYIISLIIAPAAIPTRVRGLIYLIAFLLFLIWAVEHMHLVGA